MDVLVLFQVLDENVSVFPIGVVLALYMVSLSLPVYAGVFFLYLMSRGDVTRRCRCLSNAFRASV